MSKYNNGKIYSIVALFGNEGDIYIGSTTRTLKERMIGHISKYKSWKQGKGSHVSSYDLFDEFGVDECKITLLENYSCETKEKLRKREGYYIKKNKCVNIVIAGRTQQEYRIDNRESINTYHRQYREENINKIRARERLYESKRPTRKIENPIGTCFEVFICQCGTGYIMANLESHLKETFHYTKLLRKILEANELHNQNKKLKELLFNDLIQKYNDNNIKSK